MVDSRRAVVFSATLLVLFTIPAASEQVKIQETVEKGFEATVDTNFTTNFELDINSGQEKMELIDSKSRYSRNTRPSTRIEKLTTPKGKLRIEKSPNKSVKIVKTAYGTLKTGFRDGENISTFSGPEKLRPKVEEIKTQLMKNMSVKKREASAKKAVVMDRILPDISVGKGFNESSEWVKIRNTGSDIVSLEGWTMENSDPDVFTLDRTLAPDETVILYAGEPEDSLENSVENTGVDIDENEDSLALENTFGRTIDKETW